MNKTLYALAGAAITVAALITITVTTPSSTLQELRAIRPILKGPVRTTNGWKLAWNVSSGMRYVVESSIDSGEWKAQVTTTNGSAVIPDSRGASSCLFRLRVQQPGEVVLPDGKQVIQRNVPIRASDGLRAYGYVVGNPATALRVALIPEAGTNVVTTDLPPSGFQLGCEMAWVSNSLFVVGSTPGAADVHELRVGVGYPPSIEYASCYHVTDTNSLLRWPTITGLRGGGVVAAWHLQTQLGLHARVAYRNPSGEWSTDGIWDLRGYSPSTQTAGACRAVEHPEDGSVWIIGLEDSVDVLSAAVFRPGQTLEFLRNQAITDGFPMNGIVDPLAFDGELPFNFRAQAYGNRIRILGNHIDYRILYPENSWLKLTRLVMYDVAANGAKTSIGITSNWTERCTPDYGFVGDRVYIVPVATNATVWPKYDGMDLRSDPSNARVSALDAWTPLAFGTNSIVYPRGGKLILNRL